jgi:hypothetical protein
MKKWFGILMVAALLAGFSVPAMASISDNWSLDGGVGVFTSWTNVDEDRSGKDGGDTDLRVAPWDTMYLGVGYKGDKLSADFTILLDDNSWAGSGYDETIQFDTAWAQVDFDAFSLRLGHQNALTFNPVGTPPGKYGNSGIGSNIGGTNKMSLDFIFPIAKGMKFEAMLAGPTYGYRDGVLGLLAYTGMSAAYAETDTMLPAIEVAFSAFTGFPWKVYGGYQTYTMVGASGFDDYDISAYCVGAVVRPSFGPAHINFGVNYSTNLYITEGSPWQKLPAFAGPWQWNYDPETDTTRLAFAGGVAIDITKMVGVTFGAGYQIFEAEEDFEDTMIGYYVNVPIQITKNFRVMPYISIEDAQTVKAVFKPTGVFDEYDQGTSTEYGVFWRVTF